MLGVCKHNTNSSYVHFLLGYTAVRYSLLLIVNSCRTCDFGELTLVTLGTHPCDIFKGPRDVVLGLAASGFTSL